MATTPAPPRIHNIRELSGVTSGVTVISVSALSAGVAEATDADADGEAESVGAAAASAPENPITSTPPSAQAANSRRIAIIMTASLPTQPQPALHDTVPEHSPAPHQAMSLAPTPQAIPKAARCH